MARRFFGSMNPSMLLKKQLIPEKPVTMTEEKAPGSI